VDSRKKRLTSLLTLATGYTLIMVTIWSQPLIQRRLFWVDVAFFFCAAVASFWKRTFELPQLEFTLIVVGLGITVAASMLFAAAEVGTLHGLFGTRQPLLHASMYVTWALVQQWIQQSFFFVRLERLLHRGVLASFTAAAMFGLAHLPNPVLAPVTFLGGWLLSELYRRYRSVLPLGIAHGLVGLAIALSVPDQIHHHMRVGLGYLMYGG
jgi:membrane protease YdiL (CAAX protease family)